MYLSQKNDTSFIVLSCCRAIIFKNKKKKGYFYYFINMTNQIRKAVVIINCIIVVINQCNYSRITLFKCNCTKFCSSPSGNIFQLAYVLP